MRPAARGLLLALAWGSWASAERVGLQGSLLERDLAPEGGTPDETASALQEAGEVQEADKSSEHHGNESYRLAKEIEKAAKSLGKLVMEKADADGHESEIVSSLEAAKKHKEMLELLNRIGIFRGVTLGDQLVSTGKHSQVVELREPVDPSQVQLATEVSATEFSFEGQTAFEVKKADSLIRNIGLSAFTSTGNNFEEGGTLGVDIPGISALSGKTKETSSGSESKNIATTKQEEHHKRLSQKSNSFFKSKYYWEPRARIVLEERMLQLVPSFEKRVNATDVSGDDVEVLFWEFGTHICPQVIVGGWWMLTTEYESTEMKKIQELSGLATKAIETTVQKAMQRSESIGLSMPLGEGATGSGSMKQGEGENRADERSESENEVVRNTSAKASQQGSVEVSQEWKGGISGASPTQWRRSLDNEHKANWKAIDRVLDRCVGVWEWVKNVSMKTRLCQKWVEMYLKSLETQDDLNSTTHLLKTEPIVICNSSHEMHRFRESAREVVRKEEKRAHEKWRNRTESKRSAEEELADLQEKLRSAEDSLKKAEDKLKSAEAARAEAEMKNGSIVYLQSWVKVKTLGGHHVRAVSYLEASDHSVKVERLYRSPRTDPQLRWVIELVGGENTSEVKSGDTLRLKNEHDKSCVEMKGRGHHLRTSSCAESNDLIIQSIDNQNGIVKFGDRVRLRAAHADKSYLSVDTSWKRSVLSWKATTVPSGKYSDSDVFWRFEQA